MERLVDGAIRVSKERKRPVVMVLISPELRWLGERNHHDRDTAAIEFIFARFHLTEVVLARQSCQMPEKD